jgi:hypothetical protein
MRTAEPVVEKLREGESQPDGRNVILFFLLDLRLFLPTQRSIECLSEALVDSDRPPLFLAL